MGELLSYQGINETYVRPPDVAPERIVVQPEQEPAPDMMWFADHVSEQGYRIAVDHDPCRIDDPEAYHTYFVQGDHILSMSAVRADIFRGYDGGMTRVLQYSEEEKGDPEYLALEMNVLTGVYTFCRGSQTDALRPFEQ